MTIAKFTSFFGGLLYLITFASALIFGEIISRVITDSFGVENPSLFALILASVFLFAVGNFCFSYFIQQKENLHQEVDSAFFFSLQLLIIPVIVFIGFILFFVNFSR